jgi:DNA polymerase III subunit delta
MSFGKGFPAKAAKSSESDFIASITKRPEIRLFFVFGQDESAAADIAAQLAQQLGPDVERIDIDSDKIRNDASLLLDEATSLSLFGGARYIRVNVRRDEGLAAFENLLDADQSGNPVIAIAGDLKKTSKLRKLVESSKCAITHICYAPDEGDAATAVITAATKAGLRLDRSLAIRIARYTGGDRKLAAIEVEKLALYYDASPENTAIVDVVAFEALSAETDEENVQALVNCVMSGEVRKLSIELMQARQVGVDAIRIVRALQRRVVLLASLRGKVDGGALAGSLVRATPAIFFKEKNDVTLQLERWQSSRLAGLNGHLLDIEKRLMAVKAELGAVILEQELTRIARAAARAR